MVGIRQSVTAEESILRHDKVRVHTPTMTARPWLQLSGGQSTDLGYDFATALEDIPKGETGQVEFWTYKPGFTA